jgi:hypothetical protein
VGAFSGFGWFLPRIAGSELPPFLAGHALPCGFLIDVKRQWLRYGRPRCGPWSAQAEATTSRAVPGLVGNEKRLGLT